LNKQSFINSIKDGAIEGYKKYKILPSLTMAQAILESGWGKYHIQNNLFGIKPGASWRGKIEIRQTKEFENGKWIEVKTAFRAYDSFNDSVLDHNKLIGESERYAKVRQAMNYKDACFYIWQCGYATDPAYPGKLIQIIEQNNLDKYDQEAIKMCTLKIGNRCEQVKDLQKRLNDLGFNAGNADGIFGGSTQKAVKDLQKSFGLATDGIVGKNTWAILKKLDKVKHFKLKEFRCKHCGQLKIDINLLLKLEEVRTAIGNKPIVITSGYRCPTHNKNVGGAKNSQHMYGRAADIRANGVSVKEMNQICDRIFGNGGVGLNGATITHVDTRGYKARWRYN
jgi:hypothetical protein